MERDKVPCADFWSESFQRCEYVDGQPKSSSFPEFSAQSQFGQWMGTVSQFSGYDQPFGAPSSLAEASDTHDKRVLEAGERNDKIEWDSGTILNNLSFLEKKIHQLQDLVHLIVGRRGYATFPKDEILVQQQHLITADLTSIIVQLISTAGSLLPSVKQVFGPDRSVSQRDQPGGVNHPAEIPKNILLPQSKVEDQSEPQGQVEDHEIKSDDDVDEGESLPPGSYQILQLEKDEILAAHTHFCMICGKGFKRDANLRMHMRGHGDEYKTPAALAKPNIEASIPEPVLIRRYSCPYEGCKRNKDHKKFLPLKTVLCVKNHYKRTHCVKTYMCSRCNAKKFSVIADLKTHEKHCGRDKWLCSCGTTFSRKDKLFGHIGLFQGHAAHAPAIPLEESKEHVGSFDQGQCNEATTKVEQPEFSLGRLDDPHQTAKAIVVEGSADDSTGYASPLCFDKSSLNSHQDFPRSQFNDCDTSSLVFLLSGNYNYPPRDGNYGGNSSME